MKKRVMFYWPPSAPEYRYEHIWFRCVSGRRDRGNLWRLSYVERSGTIVGREITLSQAHKIVKGNLA